MKKIAIIFSFLAIQFGFSQKIKKAEVIKDNRTTEQKFELDKKQKELFNGKFEQFMTALKASDKKTMESLMSEKTKSMVTDKVYENLSKDINFTRKIVIYKTGYKSFMTGENFPMIQYKYADDQAKPDPKEIITAVFEENGKIMGIKPYKQIK
ncbi:peptidylprolyl isomerase [Chryseobacterium chendengshani]|uniref:peptidylprolyl isomerase n=1 Tax=unclassified Chryseobacterium TaxID=2593645 RepID=UPI001C6441AA|nr:MULTISPECIES: peptidylprolyl isomerase [unclassified Chryseobacterium]MBW7674381.1 peptidylprolyl isomerase [Chryseobacterium sp. LJ756]MBW8522831.1 peptidylprolyl isomerase [Chryseobacterium sp. LJ668]QYK16363.1 peptidylprolyl isomerase [Chryseobacterium sp. LJ668]